MLLGGGRANPRKLKEHFLPSSVAGPPPWYLYQNSTAPTKIQRPLPKFNGPYQNSQEFNRSTSVNFAIALNNISENVVFCICGD